MIYTRQREDLLCAGLSHVKLFDILKAICVDSFVVLLGDIH